MKSPNFEKLNGENCRILQDFSKIWGIKTNFGQTVTHAQPVTTGPIITRIIP